MQKSAVLVPYTAESAVTLPYTLLLIYKPKKPQYHMGKVPRKNDRENGHDGLCKLPGKGL